MNDNEILKKYIGDAELILIGIGEEFFDNCNDFEKIYDDLLFDNRIEGLQMSSLFKEVLLKRWLRENVSENLEKAYSNISKMCTDKNYYISTFFFSLTTLSLSHIPIKIFIFP